MVVTVVLFQASRAPSPEPSYQASDAQVPKQADRSMPRHRSHSTGGPLYEPKDQLVQMELDLTLSRK